jgi:hypothetical protein
MTSCRRIVAALLIATAALAVPVQSLSSPPPAAPGADESTALGAQARALLARSIYAPEEWIRLAALRAAAGVADRELAAAAHRAARSHDRYERAMGLEIVAAGDPVGGRDVLVEALDSPHRGHRLRALDALAPMRDPALAEAFARRLRSDPDEDLRALAARALAATVAPSAAPALIAALRDGSPLVRSEAVRGLVALHDPAVSTLVEQRLTTAPPDRLPDEIRLAALVPDSALAGRLAPFLDHADPQVRMTAAAAIVTIAGSAPAARPR